MKSGTLRLVAALVTLAVFGPIPAHAQDGPSFNRLVIFGESTSETFNTLLLTGQGTTIWDPVEDWDGDPSTLPTEPVQGLYFMGRWSNGPVWVDVLSTFLGAQLPFPSLLGGSNYAFTDARLGGGRDVRFSVWTGDTLRPPRVPGIAKQIKAYAKTWGAINDDDLAVLWSGANDLFFADSQKDVRKAVTRTRAHIEALVGLGATHIVVPNQLDASVAPFFSDAAGVTQAQRDALSALTAVFNQLLGEALADLQAQYGGSVKLVPVDFAGTGELLFTCRSDPPPEGCFGFEDFQTPGAVVFATNARVGAETKLDDEKFDAYVFWDTIHPTAAIHKLLAVVACSTLNAYGVSCLPPPLEP